MKKLLKFTLLYIFAIVTLDYFLNHIEFVNLFTLIKVALILSIFELMLKPIIKIILFPINIITLGTFRIIIDTFGLYLVFFLIPQFTLGDFYLGTYHLSNFFAVLVSSIFLTIIINFFNFILSKKKK